MKSVLSTLKNAGLQHIRASEGNKSTLHLVICPQIAAKHYEGWCWGPAATVAVVAWAASPGVADASAHALSGV